MANITIEEFLEQSAPEVRDLALRARELILEEFPEATVKVWPGWKMIGFGTGPGMADLVCGIGPLKSRINLVFARGASLPDPEGLLEGTSAKGRHVKISDRERLESPAIRALLKHAFALGREAGGAEAATARNATSGGGSSRAPRDGSSASTPVPGISDAAVRDATGKGRAEWFSALDAAGARTMSHKEIVALLAETPGLSGWWQQMIAVEYERARGLRAANQTADGYRVSASKTIAVPLDDLYRAWADEARRAEWLPDAPITIRKATPSKSMRITWSDGTHVDVLFYAKGDAKSQVSIDHRKLGAPDDVERMRSFWRERLAALQAAVTSS